MEKYALIGYPLSHTLSPFIHGRLFELSGRLASYDVCEIPPKQLKGQLNLLMESYAGFNVTIPHKREVAESLKNLDGGAARYMSVNVVDSKTRTGYNTDVYGFNKSLRSLGANLGGKVLLLGSGGVAQMMAIETVSAGATLTIAVRESDLAQAEALKKLVASRLKNAGVSVVSLGEVSGSFDLLINATPVGMYPHTDESPVGENVVKNVKAVFDAVYNPEKTKLMMLCESLKIKCAGGMEMLVHQAAEAHRIWYGASFPAEGLNKIVAACHKKLSGG